MQLFTIYISNTINKIIKLLKSKTRTLNHKEDNQILFIFANIHLLHLKHDRDNPIPETTKKEKKQN